MELQEIKLNASDRPSEDDNRKATSSSTGNAVTSSKAHAPPRKAGIWRLCCLLTTCVAFFIALSFLALFVAIWYFPSSSPMDDTTRRLVCYVTWQNQVSIHVDPDLCTHLIIGFAFVTPDYRISLDSFGGLDNIRQFVNEIRGRRRGLPILISIGGGGNRTQLSETVSDPANVEAFLSNCEKLLSETGLSGIDYDWEFPAGNEEDNFAYLIKETRKMLEPKIRNFVLSVTVPGVFTLADGFPVAAMREHCTFINIMCYDLMLLNPTYQRAVPHSALTPPQWWLFLFTVEFSVKFWLFAGLPRTKISLGLPTYGVAYELEDPNNAEIFSPVKGYDHVYGFNVGYALACQFNKTNPEGSHWSAAGQVPYVDNGNGTWIAYDNIQSITAKVEFAKRQGLGGLMIFSLNADDPSNSCKQGKFPLTSTAESLWRPPTAVLNE